MHIPIIKRLWRKRILCVVLCGVMMLTGRLLLLRHHNSSLLRHAQRIAIVKTWKNSWWLDAHSLFVVDENPARHFTAFIIDTSSGKHTTFPGLTHTLNKLGGNCHLMLSPNGKWMVALPWMASPKSHWLISVASGDVIARHTAGYFDGWLPDSSGWIGGNLGNKQFHESIFWVNGKLPSNQFGSPSIIGVNLGITETGDSWMGEYNPYGFDDLKLDEIDRKTGSIRRTLRIPLSTFYHLSEVSQSPDRKRVSLQVRPLPFFTLSTLFASQDVNAVLIRNLDGTDMKNLGELPVEYGTDYDCDLYVEWLPDSRHLAVTYKQTLYVIPVD